MTARRALLLVTIVLTGSASASMAQSTPEAAASVNAPAEAAEAMTTYRLKGERALRPVRIGDDGERTYLEWSEEQALPAVFAINAFGEEEMADGYMRDGIYIIDRVYEKLVFRIGRNTARAFRNTR